MDAGKHKVARLMRTAGIEGVTRRKFTVTTRRDDRIRPAPDLLDRDFSATGPDSRWVADITYIPTWSDLLFLAVIVDVFSRAVVGWSMSARQNAKFLTSLKRRGLKGVSLVISDAHEGLKGAIEECFIGVAWQRCRVHFMRNALGRVPKADTQMVKAAISTIFAQLTKEDAHAQLTRVVEGLTPSFGKVAEMLESALRDPGLRGFPHAALEEDLVDESARTSQQGDQEADQRNRNLSQ